MHRGWLSAILISTLAVRADEGMWTFHNPPLAAMKEKYKFTPDAKWLEHVQLSVLEVGSASGAFVSQDGLVLTNHHVALKSIENVSGPGEKDYLTQGFVAKTRAEEIKIPDLKLYTVMQMSNVTDQVNAVVKPGMDEKQAMAVRMDKLVRLRDDLNQRNGLLAGWVSLYQGGEYWLYTYRVHRDVRLVMAPESRIAFFGGDSDNFNYPRHDLDFALLRVYEGGAPYHPPHFLKWASHGLQEGDFTFVAGQPARTRRQETIAQMKFQRDVALPARIARNLAHRAALEDYSKISETHVRRTSTLLFSIENELKSEQGELAGLMDPTAFAALETKEQKLRAAVAKDPALQRNCGMSWEKIEAAVEQMKPLQKVDSLTNSRNSKLLETALDVVRCAQELDRPVSERLEDYRTQDDEEWEKWRLQRQIEFGDLDLDRYLIEKGLEDIQARLEPENPFRKAVLEGKTPADLAREVVAGTQIQKMFVRTDLIQGRSKAIAKSKDPLIRLARTIEGFDRDQDKRGEDLWAIAQEHAGRIAHARFALFGNTIYPDATGTLRFSFGAVEGYQERDKKITPFTNFAGMYDLAERKGPTATQGAWSLPKRWQERKSGIDPSTILNFCHSVDITGGNSGSPVVNAQGEIAGVVFDGNLQSLPGDYYYDGQVNRAISLDGRAIIEALVKIYEAQHIADELQAK